MDSFKWMLDQVNKSKLARLCGVRAQTVTGWGNRNFVPSQYWDELIDLLNAKTPGAFNERRLLDCCRARFLRPARRAA